MQADFKYSTHYYSSRVMTAILEYFDLHTTLASLCLLFMHASLHKNIFVFITFCMLKAEQKKNFVMF